MRISIIAAVADNKVIGYRGKIPWYLPSDLAHFKRMTLGKPVIMGRKTYESLGKILPDRSMIVVSKDSSLQHEDVSFVTDFSKAVRLGTEIANKNSCDEIIVIGGTSLYHEALKIADTIYLTEVHLSPKGDAYFPMIDTTDWLEMDRVRVEADNTTPSYEFVTLKRIQ